MTVCVQVPLIPTHAPVTHSAPCLWNQHNNSVWLIKLTRGVCRGLPCLYIITQSDMYCYCIITSSINYQGYSIWRSGGGWVDNFVLSTRKFNERALRRVYLINPIFVTMRWDHSCTPRFFKYSKTIWITTHPPLLQMGCHTENYFFVWCIFQYLNRMEMLFYYKLLFPT